MMFDDLKRICLESCVLVALGVLVGLTQNHQLVLDAFSGQLAHSQSEAEQAEPASVALPLPAMIDDVQQAFTLGGLVVDARSPELFNMGHIAGAVSLPMADVDTGLPGFLEQVAKDRVIITYCSGFGCPDSFDLGVVLLESGYLDVRVFEGGYPEWRDAGLAVAGESR